ncbi:MAG: LamG domain-containing protein [Myxococcota bacterium]
MTASPRLLVPLLALALAACDPDGDSRFDGLDDGSHTTGTTRPGGDDDDDDDGRTTPQPNTTTSGGAQQCVVLYGGNDRVRGPDEGLPTADDARTLQAWIRTTSLREQVAISHGRPSPNQGFQLGTVDGLPMARTGSGLDQVVGDVDVADDRWHHLAVAYDGRLAVLMVDGEIVGSGELTTDTLQGDVVAGNTPTGDLSRSWIGSLDDVRIFRGARTTADVSLDPDGEGVDERFLTLWWDFEVDGGGPGITVPDLSGNGHDGITAGANGSPSFVPCR